MCSVSVLMWTCCSLLSVSELLMGEVDSSTLLSLLPTEKSRVGEHLSQSNSSTSLRKRFTLLTFHVCDKWSFVLCSRWRTCTVRQARERTVASSGATCRTWVGHQSSPHTAAGLCDTSAHVWFQSLLFSLLFIYIFLLYLDVCVLCHLH